MTQYIYILSKIRWPSYFLAAALPFPFFRAFFGFLDSFSSISLPKVNRLLLYQAKTLFAK